MSKFSLYMSGVATGIWLTYFQLRYLCWRNDRRVEKANNERRI
jgi:hypothetical protein